MPCYHPLHGYLDDSGRFTFRRSGPKGENRSQTVSCGQCVGCRLRRAHEWSVRCMHEASLWPDNVFITLTYDNDHLPANRSLDHRHWQLFMKKVRNFFGSGVRFYMCGEYGEQFGRPHYHAILYNCDFIDKKKTGFRFGNVVYTSDILSRLWDKGFHEIGSVTYKSANYVARYIMKKINGNAQDEHYSWVDPSTGECFLRAPEYSRMSLKSGIGKAWFDKFYKDVFPHDFIVVDGKKTSVPRYYTKRYELMSPEEAEMVKTDRYYAARKFIDNCTTDRLKVREKCAYARLSRMPRTLQQ